MTVDSTSPGWRSGIPEPSRGSFGERDIAADIVGSGRFHDLVQVPDALRWYMRRVKKGSNPALYGEGLIRSVPGQKAAVSSGLELLQDLQNYPAGWFVAAEAEHLEKAIIQDGYSPGWHVIPGGLHREERPTIEPGLRMLLRYLQARGTPAATLTGTSYPRNTNKGWPTYGTNDAELMLHVVMGSMVRDYDDVARLGTYVANALGDSVSASLAPHAVMWSRTGPRKKPQDLYMFGDVDLERTGWTAGIYPRRRHVFGLPTFVNACFRLEVIREKLLMRSTPVFGHSYRSITAGQVASARRRGLKVLSDDISAFDQSVAPNHQEDLARVIHTALFRETGLVDVYLRAARDMGVVSPPLRTRPEGAFLTKKGMTASGHGGTSTDGSFINAARAFMAVAKALNWSEDRTLKGLLSGEWDLWIWGDDTLLAVPNGFDEDAYVAESERLGYKCALSQAPVFLMVCYPPDGTHWNLASRAYVQSIWREHPSPKESIGIFGLWVRWNLTKDHPMRGRLWRALYEAALPDGVLERRRIRTGVDLDEHVSGPAFKTELRADLAARPAALRDLLSSLTRGTYDPSVNPDATYALALLGLTTLKEASWTPPGRVGLREYASSDGPRLLQEAIDVMLGLRTRVSEARDNPDQIGEMVEQSTSSED